MLQVGSGGSGGQVGAARCRQGGCLVGPRRACALPLASPACAAAAQQRVGLPLPWQHVKAGHPAPCRVCLERHLPTCGPHPPDRFLAPPLCALSPPPPLALAWCLFLSRCSICCLCCRFTTSSRSCTCCLCALRPCCGCCCSRCCCSCRGRLCCCRCWPGCPSSSLLLLLPLASGPLQVSSGGRCAQVTGWQPSFGMGGCGRLPLLPPPQLLPQEAPPQGQRPAFRAAQAPTQS